MALWRTENHQRDVKDKQRINEQIRVPQVRVVSAEGEQLGVMNTQDALAAARQAGLDLVEVAADSKPPVCRIMNYGKFKFEQKKKLAKHQTHQAKLKEVRFRPKTGDHDIQVKIHKAREFLVNKDKVQLSITFKGRELVHIEEGEKVLNHVLEALDDVGKIEAAPKRAEKRVVCTLAPK